MGKKMNSNYDDGERTFHWVATSNRYPTYSDSFFITTMVGSVAVCYFDNTLKKFLMGDIEIISTAWAKIPKGYNNLN
jgi:hypothetical protein